MNSNQTTDCIIAPQPWGLCIDAARGELGISQNAFCKGMHMSSRTYKKIKKATR
ncbi:hypothetical protein [Bacteroides helcogenes]|uniref:XRE family transcriptional regulator n=1 Tax=Bacteroides helcogenes (strain ATCC 35417 / DSM 20613 / JCM 6297 / CCUG 15421 / P 36-108) TaxID=693979 RepID=E6SQ74_BACT6|nr:hypothetical protein [Bacteroides helcogenes]ADV43933.1 hypothetical protein Bache_1955 [Bacteroides helcogenes P 36-108]MDY5237374.1 hypothetical protein [Bacteroides helcogenes]